MKFQQGCSIGQHGLPKKYLALSQGSQTPVLRVFTNHSLICSGRPGHTAAFAYVRRITVEWELIERLKSQIRIAVEFGWVNRSNF
jgi:hypothetical protein